MPHTPDIATLGIWTLARFAALTVLATEAFFLLRRRQHGAGPGGPGRAFWALTPALLVAGLLFWCASTVVARAAPEPEPVVAQLSP